jgi:DNA primase
VIAAFSIRYATGLPFAFTEGIVIPVNTPDGKFSFNKYRRSYLNNTIKQKYAYDKGSHTALFGADKLTVEHTSVVITEGEMDALVLWSRGIPAVSSTGGALSFQSDFGELLAGKQVYICYDNDDAGAAGLVKTLELLPEAYVIFVPEVVGVKDISDFVGRGGDFHALMQTARQYRSVGEVEEDMHLRASQWLPTRFHKAYIDAKTPKPAAHDSGVNYAGDDEVLKAKAVPCTQLHTFNRMRKGVCLWHSDSDPSLHYYAKHNNCYCHSCGKYADSIDIVMAKHHMTFKEAVKFLNNQ